MGKFHLKIPEPLEKEIQKSILDYLEAKRIFCWKEHSGGILIDGGDRYMPIGLRGKSDILGIWKGRFLAIEVKRKTGVVSPAQQYFIDRINEEGGLAFVATSIDDLIEKGI